MSRQGEVCIENVTKKFGQSVAVNRVNLTIEAGSYCCMIGPSGCGKTTLLRMIAGHETPTEGRILIGGEDVTDMHIGRRGTALMFQNYALFPHLNLVDNVSFGLKIQNMPRAQRQEKAMEMLDRMHLRPLASRLPSELSGGQQQRVALSRALITNPQVLLLDEPLSALDEFLRLRMRGELKRLQSELGITFIHVTHTQPEAIALADTIVVMDQGIIEQSGSPQTIYNRPYSPYIARFMGGQNILLGKMVKKTETSILLCDDGGNRFFFNGKLPADIKAKEGSDLRLSIRRDRISFVDSKSNDRKNGQSNLAGVVRGVEYQGNFIKISLDCAQKDEFVIYMSDEEFDKSPHKVGDNVTAAWDSRYNYHLVGLNDSMGVPAD